jgi:hypothetical protein
MPALVYGTYRRSQSSRALTIVTKGKDRACGAKCPSRMKQALINKHPLDMSKHKQ